MLMLPRTCIIVLFLSLLSAAASVDYQATSDGVAKIPPPGGAFGSFLGRRRRAAVTQPSGKARGQGQGTQTRRPPRQRRPQSWPGLQYPGANSQGAAAGQRQTAAYLVCYLYIPGTLAYQGIGASQPFGVTGDGAMYPPYASYKTKEPTKVRKRATDSSENKMFGRQPVYPYPPYLSKLTCPLYQPASAGAAFSAPAGYDPYNMADTDYPDIPIWGGHPGMYNIPDDGEMPLPYNNIYG